MKMKRGKKGQSREEWNEFILTLFILLPIFSIAGSRWYVVMLSLYLMKLIHSEKGLLLRKSGTSLFERRKFRTLEESWAWKRYVSLFLAIGLLISFSLYNPAGGRNRGIFYDFINYNLRVEGLIHPFWDGLTNALWLRLLIPMLLTILIAFLFVGTMHKLYWKRNSRKDQIKNSIGLRKRNNEKTIKKYRKISR